MRMHGETHHSAAVRALGVEPVELPLHHGQELSPSNAVDRAGTSFISTEYGIEISRPAAHADRERLVVVEQVGVVEKACLGEQVGRAFGRGLRAGAAHAGHLMPVQSRTIASMSR